MSYKVLACGSNGQYQLGTGEDEDHNTFQEIFLPVEARLSPIAKFAFGGNHTFILLEDGHLFASGNNEFGQCAFNDTRSIPMFRKVPGKWKNVSAGWEYSHLYSEDNTLYACGHGPKGELGLGSDVTIAEALTVVKGLDNKSSVVAMELSINHVIVKLADGSLYGWGVARKGQLGQFERVLNKRGQMKPIGMLWAPTKLDFTCEKLHLGRERTLLVGESLQVIGKDPLQLSLKTVKARTMWSSIHYSHNSGDDLVISSTGNNSHGQLFQYKSPSAIVDFEVGSEHGVILTKDGSVYAWGWGEHGNCGAQRNDSVTFDYLNQIYDGSDRVISMACGLATTWLVVETKEQ